MAFDCLEEKLRAFHEKQDLEKIHLSSYPKFYQKLPTEPDSFDRVKLGYDDEKTLLKKSYLKTFASHYPKLPSKESKVCIVTYVMEGLGDYSMQHRLFDFLKKERPDFSIEAISLLNEQHRNRFLPFSENHQFIYYQGFDDPSIDVFSEKLLNELKTYDLILMAPTYLESLYNYLKNHNINTLCVGEYGFYHSKVFLPKTSLHTLGLHFLELGLLWPRIIPIKDLRQIEKKNLLDALLLSCSETYYFDHHKLYFAYFQSKESYQNFLELVLVINTSETKVIDFVSTDIAFWVEALDQLPLANVHKIFVLFDGKKAEKTLNDKGLTIRFIHSGKLNANDFLLLQNLSENLIGVRGNVSLTDALSLGKIPYYDCPRHCSNFLYSLIDLCHSQFPETGLSTYFTCFLPSHQNQLTQKFLLSKLFSKEFSRQFSKLLPFLKTHYDGYNNIGSLINRSLYLHYIPSFQKVEDNLMNSFFNGSLGLSEACLALKKKALEALNIQELSN